MTRPLLLLLAIVVSGLAAANPVLVPLVAMVDFDPAGEVSLVMTPDGSGTSFAEAWGPGGGQVDATLWIQIVDDDGNPMFEFPAEDMWLQFAVNPGTAGGCIHYLYYEGGVFPPDGDSSPDGMVGWQLALRGGGWSEGPVTIYIMGMPAMATDYTELPGLPIRVNSPDIDGDLVVDLTDITLFAQDLGGPYHYRSDLCWDGEIDLSDIVLFVQGLGATCP
jgi:hypothetical protein